MKWDFRAKVLLILILINSLSISILLSSQLNDMLIKIVHDNNVPMDITKGLKTTPLFLFSSLKKGELIYALVLTQHQYKEKEISFMEDVCFNEAMYFSLSKYAHRISESISYPATLSSDFKEFFVEVLLPKKIKKFKFIRKGNVNAFAYALTCYSNKDVEKTRPLSKGILKDMFATFLYKKAFENLQFGNLNDSLDYFKAMTAFYNRYIYDAFAFISFIDLEKGQRDDFLRHVKKIDVLKLTINGIKICARMYRKLEMYDYANYFYSKILEEDPYNEEAKEYFHERKEEMLNVTNYFFKHINFSSYRNEKSH